MSTAKKAKVTWLEIAQALGVSRRTLQDWRNKFPDEVPRKMNASLWKQFAFDRSLRPARNWEAPHITPAPAPTGPLEREETRTWLARRQLLFDLLEAVHAAYAEGDINLVQYFDVGTATVAEIIALNATWNAGIDVPGLRRNWTDIFAKAALEKNEENKRQRAAREHSQASGILPSDRVDIAPAHAR